MLRLRRQGLLLHPNHLPRPNRPYSVSDHVRRKRWRQPHRRPLNLSIRRPQPLWHMRLRRDRQRLLCPPVSPLRLRRRHP